MTKLISPQLIIEARLGKQDAVDQIVRAAEGVFRRVIQNVDPFDLDDIVQNALIRLTQSLGQLSDHDAFSAWCAAIARNELRMFYRSATRREQAQLRFSFEPLDEPTQSQNPDIREALTKLPTSQQLIIHELYVSERSYQQISSNLGVPISAVKSRLHRARNRLKQELDMESKATPIPLTKTDIASMREAARFRFTGDNRDHIAGIFLDNKGYVVGTDGHHLVVRSVPAMRELSSNLMIDPTSLEAINDDANLTIHLDEVRLAAKSEQIAMGIVDQSFPDYRAILPDVQPIECSVSHPDLQRLTATVKANLANVKEATDTVLLTIDLRAETLTIECNAETSPDAQLSMSYELPVRSPNNKLGIVRMAININLLAQCIEAVDGDSIEIKAAAWNQPLDLVGDNHRSMLMPIKL